MHIAALIGTFIILGVMIYQGYQSGFYAAAASFARNLLAFCFAVTFCEPLSSLVVSVVSSFELYPGPDYLRVVCFATVFGVIFGVAGWAREKFLSETMTSHPLADRIGGTALGLVNGVIIAGFVVILWTLMPFAKCIPSDIGRIRTASLIPDCGGGLLRFYGYCARRMGGNRVFLLQDEPIADGRDANGDGRPDGPDLNGDHRPDILMDGRYPPQSFQDLNGNGVWDRGWMWTYRHHADFRVEDVDLACTTKKTIYE